MLQRLERINLVLFKLAAVVCIGIALLGFSIVVLRYGFAFGSIAAQELVIYGHAMVFLLAAAATLGQDGHVRVDIFYRNWSPARRGLVDFIGTLFLLLPVMVFVGWACWGYVADAWSRQEVSAEAGGLPFVYLLKSLILVFVLQMVLQGGIQLTRAWSAWWGTR